MKHSKCPKCHHRNDYHRRSGPQRAHRCVDTPAHHASGKENASTLVTASRRGKRR